MGKIGIGIPHSRIMPMVDKIHILLEFYLFKSVILIREREDIKSKNLFKVLEF